MLLDALMRDHAEALYRQAYGLLKEQGAAEDCVQDTLTIAVRKNETLEAHPCPKGWLFKTNRQRALQLIERRVSEQRKRERAGAVVSHDSEPDPHQDLERQRRGRCVRRCAAELPVEQREVAQHVMLGLSLREIAVVLNAPEGTVKSRWSIAKKKLIPCLKKCRGVRD